MHLPPQTWQTAAAERVLAAIADGGGEARYVGGCVRDALLGRKGSDVDMACTLPPQQTLAALEAADIKAIPTGLDHGTVTAIANSTTYELTTLRRDVACDGRHAEVAFTDDWREDAARRDFTMNALYMNDTGEVTDYFGGIDDAKAGRVRFIGDAQQRISEDGLRILRFFRFFAHYGQGKMDNEALKACTQHKAMLGTLSGERIATEMFKLLAADSATDVLEVMDTHEILAEIQLTDANFGVLKHLDSYEPLLKLAALLHGLDPEPLLQRWKLSNEDKARLRRLSKAPLAEMANWDEWQQKAALRRLDAPKFCDAVKLAMAVHPAQNVQLAPMLTLAENWTPPQFPVDGGDLIGAGIPQGKVLGDTLKRLEAEWEAEHYQPDKAALLARI